MLFRQKLRKKQICFCKLIRDTEVKEHPNIALWVAFAENRVNVSLYMEKCYRVPLWALHGKSEPAGTLIVTPLLRCQERGKSP